MSLINEALKKAQRQRSLDAAPLSSAPSGVAAAAVTTHVRAASHKRSLAPLWFGFGLVALGATAAWLVLHYGSGSSPAATQSAPAKIAAVTPSPVPAAAPATPPAPPQPAVVAEQSSAAPMVVLPTIPVIKPAEVPPPAAPSAAPLATSGSAAKPAAVPAPSPAVSTPTSSAPAISQPPAATVAPSSAVASSPAPSTPVVPVAAVLTPAEREAKTYEFLTHLRLTGVRGLDREARVLMNERVWRLNDVVSPELGLRLSAIRPGLLVFTDAQGKTYEKPY